MLNGALSHPDRWEWYAIWMVELKDGTHVGEFCFKGIGEEGDVEIGYGVAEDWRGNGYAIENFEQISFSVTAFLSKSVYISEWDNRLVPVCILQTNETGADECKETLCGRLFGILYLRR